MESLTYVASTGLESAPLENGAVLYHPDSKKFIMLNRSATLIWAELAAPRTHQQLVQQLRAAFPGVDESVARQDVSNALEQLKAFDLVSVQGSH